MANKNDKTEEVEAEVVEEHYGKEIVLKEVQFDSISEELDTAILDFDGVAKIDLESETLKDDYQLVYDAERKFANIRISAKKHMDELNAPANKFKKIVKEKYDSILGKLIEHEKFFKEQRSIYEEHNKKEKAEKARLETERIAKINSKIDAIRNLPFELIGATSEAISEVIREKVNVVDGFDCSVDDYGEYVEMAKQVIFGTNQKLVTMHDDAISREKADTEAKELMEKNKKVQEKRDAEDAEKKKALDSERKKLNDEKKAFEAEKKEKADAEAKEKADAKAQATAKADAQFQKEAKEKAEKETYDKSVEAEQLKVKCYNEAKEDIASLGIVHSDKVAVVVIDAIMKGVIRHVKLDTTEG